MPRIAAATIREHNENVLAALVDAAEHLLRTDPGQPLTAGAVATRAGIARNSIYKHVGSVDELRALVVRRHIPPWAEALDQGLAGIDDPADRVLGWARVNLEQAARAEHGWLMRLALDGTSHRPQPMTGASARTAPTVAAEPAHPAPLPGDGPTPDAEVAQAHRSVEAPLVDSLRELLGAEALPLHAELVRSLVGAGMRRLDTGDPLDVVLPAVDAGIRGLLGLPPSLTS